MDNYQEQLAQAQDKIAKQKEEINDLQQRLNENIKDINKLIQWTQSLQQDILAVYNSVTWQIGNFIAQIILRLLGRPKQITVKNHIYRILNNFETWKINYFQKRQQSQLQPYTPWHNTMEYAMWIKQFDSIDKIYVKQPYNPTISILMPLTGTGNCVNSILEQIYPNWELLIIQSDNLSITLPTDRRIKKISKNNALDFIIGDFIAILDSEAKLPVHALYEIVVTL
ncbi:hypothetical protein QUF50_09980, partial [Thiotrichales bacterium HSG1]|nr:hypothetical protein [Thiotrichales bacterium HSG1]